MIIVNSPIMQDKIIKILEAVESPKFTFVKKDGIKIYFESFIIVPYGGFKEIS